MDKDQMQNMYDAATKAEMAHDTVNRPSHYTSHPSGVECIEITEHMTFNAGNAVKYLWRNGLKDGAPSIQELEKAEWYVRREIGRLKAEALKNQHAFEIDTSKVDTSKFERAKPDKFIRETDLEDDGYTTVGFTEDLTTTKD